MREEAEEKKREENGKRFSFVIIFVRFLALSLRFRSCSRRKQRERIVVVPLAARKAKARTAEGEQRARERRSRKKTPSRPIGRRVFLLLLRSPSSFRKGSDFLSAFLRSGAQRTSRILHARRENEHVFEAWNAEENEREREGRTRAAERRRWRPFFFFVRSFSLYPPPQAPELQALCFSLEREKGRTERSPLT